MEPRYKIGLDPSFEEKMRGRTNFATPFFYVLGDMKFATLTRIPEDIYRDMQCRANFIRNNPFLDEKAKTEEIKNIFHRGSEKAKGREYMQGDSWPKTLKAETPYTKDMALEDLRRMEERINEQMLRNASIKMSDFLENQKTYHPGGILAQINENYILGEDRTEPAKKSTRRACREQPSDEVELKLPKKHSTHINL